MNVLGDAMSVVKSVLKSITQFTVKLKTTKKRKTRTSLLETSVKVIDLVVHSLKGGKIGLFGGKVGVGTTLTYGTYQLNTHSNTQAYLYLHGVERTREGNDFT